MATLREYLEFIKKSPKEFSKTSSIDYNTIRNILKGYEARYSTCIKIEELTHGAVTYKDLAPTRTRTQRKLKAGSHQEDEDQAVS